MKLRLWVITSALLVFSVFSFGQASPNDTSAPSSDPTSTAPASTPTNPPATDQDGAQASDQPAAAPNAPPATVQPANPDSVKHDGSKKDVDAIGNRKVGGRGMGNWYSLEGEIKMGKGYAQQVEASVKLIQDPVVNEYVNRVGQNLVRNSDAQVPFTIKVVDSDEINAFALPGGFFYVNSGLILAADEEAELAGVMAHEIAHVALRHPTNQATKAYLAQAGLGVLGGLIGGKTPSSTGQIIGAVGGFGLNSLFLKFSRSAESQADVVGSQIMARAGYNPIEMATFFGYLAQQAGGDPGKFATFMSDHPAPANREARVRQEAGLLGPVHLLATSGNLRKIQTQVSRLPAAPTTAPLAQNQAPTSGQPIDPASGLSIESPSSQFHVFRQSEGVYQLEQPNNWDAYVASGGYGVTIVPRGGFTTASSGRQNISYGVIVNHYVPFDGAVGASFVDPNGSMFGQTPLDEAASDLVRNILSANPYLTRVGNSTESSVMAGHPTLTVRLAGRSPDTGINERVTVLARQLPDDHVVYMLLIAPESEYAALTPTFDRMVRSFRGDERASHD
jgi:Zn-dependent protease with chaperone function